MRTKLLLFLCLIGVASYTEAQIKVSENNRFLSNTDGTPFFWLGDTDWEMFHRLTREEATELIDVRSVQGYNVLQAVALAEFNGIREPNRYGDYPLNNEDPTQLLITPGADPNNVYQYDYWDHVDFIIDYAASRGIYIGLLPTWGDKVAHLWGEGPIIFDAKNAEIYGSIIATRYRDRKNILWIVGGDRHGTYTAKIAGEDRAFDDRPIWNAMAKGIESVVGRNAFLTYHPAGGPRRTSEYLHSEPWLDMNAFQSGHGSREAEAWQYVKEDLAFEPQKPVLDMEPCYEDHPVNPWDGKWTRKERGYFGAIDVRARTYRSVFAGACGVTYGHHHIWGFTNTALYKPINPGDTIIPWRTAAQAEAATQMKHLKNLMLSRPYFTRVPDQSIIKSTVGTTYKDILVATRDESGAFGMIYLPQNKPVTVDLSKISGNIKKVWWFDVRSGQAQPGKDLKGNGLKSLSPPREGEDWVLVIDDAAKKFDSPGVPMP
jgi:hypothetical protein